MIISEIFIEITDTTDISLINITIRYFQDRFDPNQNYNNKNY